jgi:hypothetical protein
MTVSAVRAVQMTNVNQEVLMNDPRREVTATRRPTIEMVLCAVLAAAGSSDLVAGT